ncbi:MAG: aldo/keto reductase [Theionarchaea archaeon]|nr:aldo/keto reductase [Theionarchaea archaeon]
MKYRTFGSLDWKPSALGFGAMRLPVIDDDHSKINEPEATRMIRYAIDHGVNYVDTAYVYHKDTCEAFLGRALQDGYREKVKLATKLPSWLIKSKEDLDTYFNEHLKRLQTDHIDFYLLHALREQHWNTLKEYDVLDWAQSLLDEGKISYLGFSFHDTFDLFKEIVDCHEWTFCQIQYNYMDEEYQAGTKGLHYAAQKGLGVVIMEPIRGGQLASPPQHIRDIFNTAPQTRSPAEWALQWVWNHPEVSLVLSGMSTMEQVVENVASADRSRPNMLTAEELEVISRVRDAYRDACPIPCTDCRYCQPCPEGVRIPLIIELYNDAKMFNALDESRRVYKMIKEEQRADRCIECGECEEKCPQSIEIRSWLKKAHELLKSEDM